MAGNLVEYFEVRRAIRRFQPAFVYKRHARNDVAALWAARHAGVPAVLEVNCLFTGPGYRDFEPMALEPMAVRLERQALTLATLRLAVSTPLARLIETRAGIGGHRPAERRRSRALRSGPRPARRGPDAIWPRGLVRRGLDRRAARVAWAGAAPRRGGAARGTHAC